MGRPEEEAIKETSKDSKRKEKVKTRKEGRSLQQLPTTFQRPNQTQLNPRTPWAPSLNPSHAKHRDLAPGDSASWASHLHAFPQATPSASWS